MYDRHWFGDLGNGADADATTARLAAAVGKACDLKPFPAAAQEVMRVLSHPEFEMHAITRAIERDPALATRLLRVANSALFRSSLPCDSIDMAVVRLGGHTIGEIVAGVAAMEMFGEQTGISARLRNHCVGVAAIARSLGNHFRFVGVPQLFLCGLVHDVGSLIMLQSRDLDYDALPPEALAQVDQLHRYERQVLDFDHAVLGAYIMDMWQIPYPVSAVVAWHHQPEQAHVDGNEIALMVEILRLADTLEHHMQVVREPDEGLLEALIQERACSLLGISASDIRDVWPQLLDAQREAAELLQIG